MEIYVSITRFTSSHDARGLRDLVRRLEDAGVDGVNMFDHVFHSFHVPRQFAEWRLSDPLTVLAGVAALSDTLGVSTGILCSDWYNPGLLFRQYNQLALLASGDRVTAGIGAGWSTEEFRALGAEWNPMPVRLDRLEETLEIASQLYTQGYADFHGTYRSASNLPLTPVPPLGTRPKLMTGGGSDRIMQIAGRYCDLVDVNGVAKKGAWTGVDTVEKNFHDQQRKALTTVDDVAEVLGVARAAAKEVGRPESAVTATVFVTHWFDGSAAAIKRTQEDWCEYWGHIPNQSLEDNPYVLLGSPAHVAETLKEREERAGISRFYIHDEYPMDEVVKFVTNLMPYVK